MEATPHERDVVFKRLKTMAANRVCFDCHSKSPSWASPFYGVWLCLNCAASHRALGVHLSFVRSTQLDQWSYEYLWNMKVGGNAKAQQFFKQHGTETSASAPVKYNSRAAALYRDKIASLTALEMKKYGETNILHDDAHHAAAAAAASAQPDFFDESQHMAPAPRTAGTPVVSPSPTADVTLAAPAVTAAAPALTTMATAKVTMGGGGATGTTTSSTTARKSAIGARKTIGKKTTGLGAKKATKEAIDFDAIEREAKEMEEERKRGLPTTGGVGGVGGNAAMSVGDGSLTSAAAAVASAGERVAYQAGRSQATMTDEKKRQLERLGMGVSQMTQGGATSVISHSASSEMTVVQQEGDDVPQARAANPYRHAGARATHSPFAADPFASYGSPSASSADSNPYASSSGGGGGVYGRDSRVAADDFFSQYDRHTSASSAAPTSTAPSSTSAFSSHSAFSNSSSASSSAHRAAAPTASSAAPSPSLSKFANAKGISSDQVFGTSSASSSPSASSGPASSARFSNSGGISSDTYFGNPGGSSSGGGGSGGSNDFANQAISDIEALKKGASIVVGRLTDALSDFQVRYGQ